MHMKKAIMYGAGNIGGSADLMATAVGANMLSRIVKPIIQGLRKSRSWQKFSPLNIVYLKRVTGS